MTTYVYGGNFEGIQSYIYGTDKLKEIVGASELLNEICSAELFSGSEFDYQGAENSLREKFGFNLKFDGNFEIIQAAASKLRIVFEKEDDCRMMMKEFPKIVRQAAPGIEFSQAFARQESGNMKTIDKKSKEELEGKLAEKKNMPSTLYYPNLMIVKRANRTGLPVTGKSDKDEWLDEANIKKRDMTDYSMEDNAHKTLTNKVLFGNDSKSIDAEYKKWFALPVEIGQIANSNSFIAVVHADGNGLGNLIQKMGENTPLKEFSKALDDCTVNSAKDAFGEIVKKDGNWKLDNNTGKKVFPFRPIILGGDDFTFVCKADDAVEFTKRFIQIFEEKTAKKECLNKNGGKLTVCAGIAFVKENYPMHFAYDLAESLCDLAKDKAKKLQRAEVKKQNKKEIPIPSCIAFRKELGSFAENFENIKEANAGFVFGPYAVNERKGENTPSPDSELPHIDDLNEVVKVLKNNNSFKSFLRNWMSEELVNPHSAQLLKERFMQVAGEKHPKEYREFRAALKKIVPQAEDDLTLEKESVSPVLDILTLISIADKDKKEANNDND